MPEKRGNKFMGVVYDPKLPKGRARRGGFLTEREAAAWEHDSKARLMRGEPLEMGEAHKAQAGVPHTLQELRDYVVETHWSNQRGGITAILNSQSIVNVIGRNVPYATVSRSHITKAVSELLKGNSQVTVNKKLSCLSLMLKTAKGEGWLSAVPDFPKRFKEGDGRSGRFTEEHEEKALALFRHLGNELMVDLIEFCLDTGFRQGEVRMLTGAEFNGRTIIARAEWTKAGKTRTVPLTDRARMAVERRLAANGGDRTRRLFPVTKAAVRYAWEALRDQLGFSGVRHFSPHLMRHEFCSRLAERGVPAPTIMELAGHEDMSTSQRYVRVSGVALEAAMALMNKPSHPVAAAPADVGALLKQLAAMGVLKDGVDLSKLETLR